MKTFLTILFTIIISCVSHLFCMETAYSIQKPNAIVYAPWRENYVNTQQKPKNFINQSCTLCNIINNKNNRENLILHRGNYSLIMLASQPYISNGIHFLVIPYEHKKELCNLSSSTYHEENIFTQKLCGLFSSNAHQAYINSNQGLAAGASIPEHHHRHIIINYAPNFYNFIEAIRETKKAIDLLSLYKELQPQINCFQELILPQHNQTICSQNCYYCSVIRQDTQQNLIIYRGKQTTVMFSHYPTYLGEIDIIPNQHIEAVEMIPAETYEEINQLTVNIYPLILKIIDAQDSNIGLISYGNKAKNKDHIVQKIIPRKDNWKKTPITQSNHVNGDIKKIYRKLLLEWHSLLNKNYEIQKAKL